jgi:hypothetical protein
MESVFLLRPDSDDGGRVDIHIVVGLDGGRRALERERLDHVGIEGTLHEELDLPSLGWVISGGFFNLDCLLLKNVDKLATFSAVNFETIHSHWLGGGIREGACM